MNCIVNNNDFPGLTGLEVAANWRPNPNHGVPSTLLLRKNLFQINHKSSFWCTFPKHFDSKTFCNTNNKRNSKENRRDKLHLKVRLKLYLNVTYIILHETHIDTYIDTYTDTYISYQYFIHSLP